ncbi:MAG: hypothetical protein U1C33_04635, partial [Candidatus Cloacimonadaceae bacterium]|nr:hypothetical protein [Candidatus Cloacimonadaceae bacterium]
NIPFEIETTAVFGACVLPDKSSTAFGSNSRVINRDADGKAIRVEATAVFGRVEFTIRPGMEPVKPFQDTIEPVDGDF